MPTVETEPKPARLEVAGLTIDSEHSKDLDDAFWVTPEGDGYLVDVSIADVAAVVKAGTPMDRAAAGKVETEYLRSYNRPMLPRGLSEDRCSLLPGQRRKVLTTRMRLDAGFRVVEVEIVKATVCSQAKLSHGDVDLALLEPDHPLHEQLALCQRVASAFYDRRRERGACAIYDVRSRLYADEDGVLRKYDSEFFHAQMIVQEFMIAANEQQAIWAARADVPFIYRSHEATTAAPGREQVMAQVVQALIHPEQLPGLNARMTLWMKRAEYGTKVLGHFGLNLPAYAHVTSPIRRYVDLVNQRILKAALKGYPSPYTADELTAIAEAANTWRREKQQAKEASLKAKTIEERRQQLTLAESFAGMGTSEFGRLLKRAIKDELRTPALVAEIAKRAAAGTLDAFDVYNVLFRAGEAWGDEKAAALAQLDGAPHLSVSILNLLRARDGVGYDVAVMPSGRRFYATAIAQVGDRKTRATAEAPTKKVACGLAATAWIRGRVQELTTGAVVLEDDDGSAPAAPAGANGCDFVSAIQELCHERKLPLPVYRFDRSGPSHAPTFTCSAAVADGPATTGEAPTKREAKQQAAQQLYAQLRQA